MSRRRVLLLAAAAAAVATLALGAFALGGVSRPVATAAQTELIARELRCPTCEGLSVADSPSRPAAEMRAQIEALLAEGRTASEVKRHFVERYGEWILLAPTSPAAWLIPPLVVLAAGGALAVWLMQPRPMPGPPVEDQPRDRWRDRVREDLEAFDA